MDKKTIGSTLLLVLVAFIWGVAFVAQSTGMEYVGPFTFNACRFLIGGIVLVPYLCLTRQAKRQEEGKKKTAVLGGICCGAVLSVASLLQQLGIAETTVGKAGFITALYIVIVPLLGIFLKRKLPWSVWVSVALAVIGMYLLCMTDGLEVSRGDWYVFLCAVCFSFHILVIDYFSPKADGVMISCVQFFTAGIIAAVMMLLFEAPKVSAVVLAGVPILYAGVMSCGVAYTLQVVAQKNTDPVLASLILSLESVFSLLAGWVLLGQKLSPRELGGCGLVFCAILLAQVPAGDKGMLRTDKSGPFCQYEREDLFLSQPLDEKEGSQKAESACYQGTRSKTGSTQPGQDADGRGCSQPQNTAVGNAGKPGK